MKKRLKNSKITITFMGNEAVGRRSKSILNAPVSTRNLEPKLPEIVSFLSSIFRAKKEILLVQMFQISSDLIQLDA